MSSAAAAAAAEGDVFAMKVLFINGSPHERGATYTALREVEKVLLEGGVETEWVQVGKKPVAGCVDCGFCGRGGRCVFNDDVNRILDGLDAVDAIVVGSPVYYAGPSGQVRCLLDRLFFAGSDRFAGKVGAAVVSCRRGGAATAFDQLNKYFSISNMPIATSQYWNQNHGNNAAEAAQDTEGMQTMRTLGQNILWMLRSIEAGKRAGIPAPAYEAPAPMNFIH